MAAVVQPCDAGVISSTRAATPCRASSRPWVIAAAALGSGMAFLDSTVLNVALPAIQADLGATAQDAQWVFGAYALVLAALMLLGAPSATTTAAGGSSLWVWRSSPPRRCGAPSPWVRSN